MMTSISELLDFSKFITWLGDCQILKWTHDCEFGLFITNRTQITSPSKLAVNN
jgi:hypothetical protein